MENLEDSNSAILSMPVNPNEQNSSGNPAQSSLDSGSITKSYLNNPYPTTAYTGYGNYQNNSYMSSYNTGQPYYGNSAYYQQQTPQSVSTATQSQSQPASPLLQSSNVGQSAFNYHNYPATSASFSQNSYPVSSQYQQHQSHYPSSPQASYSQSSYSHSPSTSAQNLLSQMNQGLVGSPHIEKPTPKRRREEKPVKQQQQQQQPAELVDNWDRPQYHQQVVRKRSKKNYNDDLDDDDLEDDLEIDERELEELQNEVERVERKSTRDRKPTRRQASQSPPKRIRTPKKKELEEPEIIEETNQEVEVQWPEDALIESNEETNVKKYSSVVVNGNTYSVGDAIALWPESKKAKPPMGTIKSLFQEGENNNVECTWFYRAEETSLKGKEKQAVGSREVFLSEHTDTNACESIWKKVSVKSKYEVPDVEEYIKEQDCYYYASKYNHLELAFEDL